MTERFEDILVKREEACMRCLEIKEEQKTERIKLLMDAIDKKLKLEERRAMIEERKVVLEKKEGEDRRQCVGCQDVDLEC